MRKKRSLANGKGPNSCEQKLSNMNKVLIAVLKHSKSIQISDLRPKS